LVRVGRTQGVLPAQRQPSRELITNVIAIVPAPSSTMRAVATERLTREQSKALTRERLLLAARAVFARRGFHAASVEEIAAEGGYSTGALYSNFSGKEDLFLAVMDREIDEHAREIEEAVREREPDVLLLFMEFWAYAARDEGVRRHVADSFARARATLTRLIADGARDFELELALPAEQLAIAIDALADGIARQKMADPEAVPDELMGRVLALLLAGATRPASP
jgi:AcrR family transcriptional regulator